MGTKELLASFDEQLAAFDKHQSFVEKAKARADSFKASIVEKVILEHTARIAVVTAILDPLVPSLRAAIADLSRQLAEVQNGVEESRLQIEELDLRVLIGEIAEEDKAAAAGDLAEAVATADSQAEVLSAERAALVDALERWSAVRPGGALESDDGVDDVLEADADDGVELSDDDGVDVDVLAAFEDGGRGEGGQHSEASGATEDLSGVLAVEAEPSVETPIAFGEATDDVADLALDDIAVEPVGAAGTPTASLVTAEGTHEEHVYLITKSVFRVGRLRDNEVQVRSDAKVSRYHFEVEQRGGDFVLVNKSGANGTFVDGARIDHELVLKGGEEIVAGETAIRFRLDA